MVYTLKTTNIKNDPNNISNREIYLPKHYENGIPIPSALVAMLGKQQIVKSVRERNSTSLMSWPPSGEFLRHFD